MKWLSNVIMWKHPEIIFWIDATALLKKKMPGVSLRYEMPQRPHSMNLFCEDLLHKFLGGCINKDNSVCVVTYLGQPKKAHAAYHAVMLYWNITKKMLLFLYNLVKCGFYFVITEV